MSAYSDYLTPTQKIKLLKFKKSAPKYKKKSKLKMFCGFYNDYFLCTERKRVCELCGFDVEGSEHWVE